MKQRSLTNYCDDIIIFVLLHSDIFNLKLINLAHVLCLEYFKSDNNGPQETF